MRKSTFVRDIWRGMALSETIILATIALRCSVCGVFLRFHILVHRLHLVEAGGQTECWEIPPTLGAIWRFWDSNSR